MIKMGEYPSGTAFASLFLYGKGDFIAFFCVDTRIFPELRCENNRRCSLAHRGLRLKFEWR